MAPVLYDLSKAPHYQKTQTQANESHMSAPPSTASESFVSVPPSTQLPPLKNSNVNRSSNPCSIGKQSYLPQLNFNPPSQDTDSMNQIFKSLFGSGIPEWPYSEDSFQKAILLRISQEKTKQEYYKVERLNRAIELMKLAAIAKVPGHLIPCLFEFGESPLTQRSSSPSYQLPVTPPTSSASPLSPSPSPVKFCHRKHSRGHTISKMTDLRQDPKQEMFSDGRRSQKSDLNNDEQNTANNNPMKNFKFGLGSAFKGSSPSYIQRKRTSLPPRHQLSPSRIGAQAISSLHRNAGTSTSVNPMNLRHGSAHNRTLSLPASVSIPETKPMEFHSRHPSQNHTGNHFKQITIPDLSQTKNPYFCRDLKTANNTKSSDSEEEQDVEKLLEFPEKCDNSFLKRRKLINGSPLKEMVLIADETENTTIIEKDRNDSIVDLSIISTSTFTSSSPIKTKEREPKTP